MQCMYIFNFYNLIDIIFIFLVSLCKRWFNKWDHIIDHRFRSRGYWLVEIIYLWINKNGENSKVEIRNMHWEGK